MESERLTETPLLAAIRDLRVEIERLIEEQKRLVTKSTAGRDPEPAIVRAPFAAGPPPAIPASAPPPAAATTKSATNLPRPNPSREPGHAEAGGDDIGKRLKDLNSRLERLKMTAVDAGEAPSRPGS
jgi:hypothetical protein